MIVETARQLRKVGGTLKGYRGVLGLSPRTLSSWMKNSAGNAAAPSSSPSQKLSPPDVSFLVQPIVRAKLKTLVHRRHRTYGIPKLWDEFNGHIRRADFRILSADVRDEVKRDRRNALQRYEFLYRDVAHSLDYTELPRSAPDGPKQYLAKVMDDFARLTLKRAFTLKKGAGYGGTFVHQHLAAGAKPLALKFDWEFAVEPFLQMVLDHGVIPLPSPRAYPCFNAKTERSYRDPKEWLAEFGKNVFWTEDELAIELDLCYTQLDEVEPRDVLGGRTARVAYEDSAHAPVDQKAFFREAVQRFDTTMRQSTKALHPCDAWRYVAKEMLKQYGLVRYSRPCKV